MDQGRRSIDVRSFDVDVGGERQESGFLDSMLPDSSPFNDAAMLDAAQEPSQDLAIVDATQMIPLDMAAVEPDMTLAGQDMGTAQDSCRTLRLNRNELKVFGFGYAMIDPVERTGCALEMSAVNVLRQPGSLFITWTFWVETLVENARLGFRATIPPECAVELRINGSVFRGADNLTLRMAVGETMGEYQWLCPTGNPDSIQRLRVVLE